MALIEAQDLAIGDVIDDGSLTPVLGMTRDGAGRIRLTLPGRLHTLHPRTRLHVLATPPGRYVLAEQLRPGDSLGLHLGTVMNLAPASLWHEGEIRVVTTRFGLICRKHQPVRVAATSALGAAASGDRGTIRQVLEGVQGT